uniref:Coiled-coil domain-containing protein 9 n=1 Tax=Arion vulgaris TaxID=1028688 RepID=A0A0B7AZE3_9EUPU
MAARPKSFITADTDVNLDFLTKEEKEALLSKKMDMIRQRNKALTERHKLIEADKKKAEEAGQAVKPTVDSQTLPAEGALKPRGRGRGQPHNKEGNRLAKERPKSSGDFRDSSDYEPIVDTTDLANYRSKGRGAPYDRDVPNNTPKNKRKPAPKEEATTFSSNFEYEPIIDMNDLDKRFGHLLNTLEGGSWPHTDHGPPPDPSFNPLADRRRSDKKEEGIDHRRHPRNYGGSTDLTRVKQNMKNLREKEKDKPQGSKPLDMVMTGKERRNHEEWKAERERYDKERIQRQMSDAGNWKRAWDADKNSQENEDQSAGYSSKLEPAKRPAGRIGSGRFDRGERDERPRSAVIVKGAVQNTDHLQQQQRQHHLEQQQQQQHVQTQVHPHPFQAVENKISRGRGRGRGRGRSRGSGSGEKFPRPKTWSGGDDRFVECQKELLLVKFDNTAGDNSVEVEYDDDEFLSSPANSPKSPPASTTPGRGPTGRTPNQVPKPQPHGGKLQQQKNKAPRNKDKSQTDTQQAPIKDNWNVTATSPTNLDQSAVAFDTDETHMNTSSRSQSYVDSEEWEDCTESSGVHEEDDEFVIPIEGLSNTATDISNDMYLECRLNPEAPEFLPSSPDLINTPLAHAGVLPWITNGSLSCPSSQESEISVHFPHGPSTSSLPLPGAHFPESLITSSQLKEKLKALAQVSQPSSLSSEDPFVSQKAPVRLQKDKDDSVKDVSAVGDEDRQQVKPSKLTESSKITDKSTELKDVNVACLTTPCNGTKDTKPPSDVVADAAVDVLNKLNEGEHSNTTVSPSDKTTIGHISACHPKELARDSSKEESKDTSKESAVTPNINSTHDCVNDKDLVREVSMTCDPAKSNSKLVSFPAEKAVNGDGSSEHKMNQESGTSEDHTLLLSFSAKEEITNIHKEGNGEQEDLKVPEVKLVVKDNDCSDANFLTESQISPLEDETGLPTANVSALS